ncbi:hypothetical protein CHU92_10415 [Flavobacterium cyanobacteriorum]|uniref:Uncharacterized protein n=1 Tax=Flavobacterium cyanobacteriorum TaxID=2022802 RepID=A0A255Z2T3_9FLAO|nr:hypothetical protein [Flavobacterium cyanobacteriorum]OYQ35762.1 hypothetical protein CHU92_10415 [Flavobacterium cyanobacteriorum]
MATKSWTDKLYSGKKPVVKKLDYDFAGIPAHSAMLVATPEIIDNYIREIPEAVTVSPEVMRKDIALAHGAEYTCPVSTGIFLRIVAEASYEQYLKGTPADKITPFWRVVAPSSPLAKKLASGTDFILKQRAAEGQ